MSYNFSSYRLKDHELLWSQLGKNQPLGSSGLYFDYVKNKTCTHKEDGTHWPDSHTYKGKFSVSDGPPAHL